MNKKTMVMLGTGFLLIAAGVGYYYTYPGRGSATPVITALTEPNQASISNIQADMDRLPEAALTAAAIGKTQGEATKLGQEGYPPGQALGAATDSTDFYIHLCGAVRKPAVYRVGAGARLVDVIALAEGLTEAAAGDYINQAMLVADGQRIYIPTKDELKGLSPEEFIVGEVAIKEEETKQRLVNINRAGAGELMELPGIGEAKAESIIAYRNANGAFTALEELMQVPGIKEGLFGQIVAYITVE